MSLQQQRIPRMEDSLPRIFGRYLLVERLSRGGMGEIFLARHGLSGFEKLVVIKKVLPHFAADREFLTRFIDEAQVAVHLQHANVAQVFEVGRSGDEYFLALEYISGSDLRATMAALAARGRAMPVELGLFIAREVANGLAYAHRRTDAGGAPLALVHCDISPPNVMLSFEGEVKIIDFGIARSRRRLTETNPDRGFGKFGYLAPEQLVKGFVVDQRTDVYALGVVLFEMLTGRHMFEIGKHPDYRMLARQVVKGEHPLPSAINPSLAPFDRLVAMALRPNAAERYQTAAEFRDALQRALVAVSPTINPDHLAALLRELLGDDVSRRRKAASLDKTELERWQQQLTSQASSTISFALAAGERAMTTTTFVQSARVAVNGEGPARPSRSAAVTAAPALAAERVIERSPADTTPDAEEHVPTVDQSVRFGQARRTAWSRRRLVVWASVLILAGGFGAGAWYAARHLLGGGRAAQPRQAPATAIAPAAAPATSAAMPAATPAAATGTVPAATPGTAHAAPGVASSTAPGATPLPVPATAASAPGQPAAAGTQPTPSATPIAPGAAAPAHPPQSPSDIQVRELPPDEADAYEPPPRGSKQPPRVRRKPDRRRPRDGASTGAAPSSGAQVESAAPDAAAVQRRFRVASQEYTAFKERYGERLETSWKDLSHLASYAQSTDGLIELDRKIGLFRAEMRAIQQDKDRSIDPF